MSISFINRKFEALSKKEKAVNDYYDPLAKHEKQHPHIQDLRDDYREDLNNYGFSKYQLKKDIETRQNQEEEEENTIHPNIDANLYQSAPQTKSLARPMTAYTAQSPPTMTMVSGAIQRPITAGNYPSDDLDVKYFSQTAKESKFWRNTKKFDTSSQNQVRNQSALQRIMLNQPEKGTLEMQEQYHKQVIEDRINLGKLGLSLGLADQKLYQKKSQKLQNFRKKSPTDKDKHSLYNGFQEQKWLLTQKSAPKWSRNPPKKEKDLRINRRDQQKNNYMSKTGTDDHQQEERLKMTVSIIHKNQEKLEFLKKIEKPILQQKFLNIQQDYQNDDLFRMKWDHLPLSQVVPFHLAVIEIKTMNIVNINNLMLNEERQLVYIDQQQDSYVEIDFQHILHQLYLKSEQIDIMFPVDNLYYILIYQQGGVKSVDLLFERFFYQGALQIPITYKVENLFTLFYIRLLMIQDQTVSDFMEVLNNSFYVIQKGKQQFPQQLYTFISQMQIRKISLQDGQQNIIILELYDILTDAIFNEQPIANLNQSTSSLNFDVQLIKMLETQSSRPQTAFVQKQASVQTLERMNKLNKKFYGTRPQSSIYSYQAIDENKALKFQLPKSKPQQEQNPDLMANFVQPHTQRSQASQVVQPVDSQFAMSLNFGGDNMEGVLKLLSTKSPGSQDVGVFQAKGRMTLRPQTALKKKEPPAFSQKREQSDKRIGSANAYSDQQNLKLMRNIRGMANNIWIKGTQALNDDFT